MCLEYIRRNYLRIFLGISLLFENVNIDGVTIIDSNSYNNININYQNYKKDNILLIKIHDLSLLENINFMEIINQYLEFKFLYVILYISENAINNKNIEKFNFNFNNKNLIKKYSFFYSEKPIKNLSNINLKTKIEDYNGGLILEDDDDSYCYNNNKYVLNSYNNLFLIQKFNIIKYKGFISFIVDYDKIIFYNKYYDNNYFFRMKYWCFNNLVNYINKNYRKINYIYCFNKDIISIIYDFDENIKAIYLIKDINDSTFDDLNYKEIYSKIEDSILIYSEKNLFIPKITSKNKTSTKKKLKK